MQQLWQNQFVKVIGGIFLLLVLVKLFNIAYPINVRITNTTESSEFTVNGTGKVEVKPDVAVVDAGIMVSNVATAEDAKTEMTAVNNRVLRAIKALGIEDKDIETSSFNIYPEYATNGVERPIPLLQSSDSVSSMPAPAQNDQSKISGYSGNATITIKVRKTELASQVVEQATAAGANNVSGPRFTVDDPEVYQEKARSEAIKNAKEQAEKLAKELGIRLGKVTNMIETSGAPYDYYGRGAAAMEMSVKDAELPEFEEGTDTITSSVTLFFERK